MIFRTPSRLNFFASLWIASLGNLALWRAMLQLSTETTGGLWLATFVLIAAFSYAFLSVCAWPWLQKNVIILLLLASSAGSYFMWVYGAILDTPMMANMLQTDTREALDLIGWRWALTVLLLAVLPAWWVLRQNILHLKIPRQALSNCVGLLCGLGLAYGAVQLSFQSFSSLHRNHMDLRSLINPWSAIYSLAEIATEPLWGRHGTLQAIGLDAQTPVPASTSGVQTAAPLLILVLGETGRAGNLGINGYARETTPQLASLQATDALFTQKQAMSCGTSTAASVPCMFSPLGKEAFEASRIHQENLLDVLSHAGLAVLWVDNQSGCKEQCDRVNHVQLNGEAMDEGMIDGLAQRINNLPKAQRDKGVVVVLHQMGSHGPAYFKRSPPSMKPFQIECKSEVLSDCPREAVVNAYDNSIRYLDHFLAKTIFWLKGSGYSNTAMLYVADHGESLGENNLYLHGLPYSIAPMEQKHVPWLTWFSPNWLRAQKLNVTCLKQREDAAVTHDHYFHSILGLMQVKTVLYKPDLDLYKPCR